MAGYHAKPPNPRRRRDDPINRGLRAGYLIGSKAGTILRDMSGYGNNGTLVGFTFDAASGWTYGLTGSALKFNGSTSYITVPDSPSLNVTGAGFSILLKAKATAPGVAKYIVQKTDTTTFGYGLYTGSAGNLKVLLGGGGGLFISSDLGVSPWDGTERTIAYTYDGANVRGWLDGILRTTDAFSSPIASGAGTPMLIGSFDATPTPTFMFPGTIDGLRIFDRCLSPAEVNRLTGDNAAGFRPRSFIDLYAGTLPGPPPVPKPVFARRPCVADDPQFQ